MNEIEKLKIDYLGYSSPATGDEIVLEILGLRLAVKCAEQRIALLEQGLQVAKMKSVSLENSVNTTTQDE